jgi:hypothetical protein
MAELPLAWPSFLSHGRAFSCRFMLAKTGSSAEAMENVEIKSAFSLNSILVI